MLWTKTKTRLWSLEWDVYMYINIKHTYMGTSWEKFWCCWKWLWWESKSTWEDLFTSSPWLLSLRSCLWWLRFQLGTIHWLIIFSQPFFSFLVFLSLSLSLLCYLYYLPQIKRGGEFLKSIRAGNFILAPHMYVFVFMILTIFDKDFTLQLSTCMW